MAENNKGLKFNPYATFDTKTAGMPAFMRQQNVSVPKNTDKVVSEYYAPTVPKNTFDVRNITPRADILAKSTEMVNQFINTPVEQFDPMYGINQWDLGLNGLSKGERAAWERENAAYTQGMSDIDKDRMWRNQQFVDVFDMDDFNSLSKEQRDAKMENKLTAEAIQKKFYNNEELPRLLSLTPEGRRELLNSDYKNIDSLKKANKEEDEKGWWDYSLSDRWNAFTNDAVSMGQTGILAGSAVGSTLFSILTAGLGLPIGAITGGAIGGAGGMLAGMAEGILHPEDAHEINKLQMQNENEEVLNRIITADNERKKEKSKDEINARSDMYIQAYNNGEFTKEQVDAMFDEIALNGKKTSTDELGNTDEYDYTGSNYYSAFKDTDEFEHFSTTDKLKAIAQAEILAKNYGKGDALQVLDQDMANVINKNQSGWTWAGNTLKNLWVGGLANMGQKVNGFNAFVTANWYGLVGAMEKGDFNYKNFLANYEDAGDAALANYLEGKDASGDGSDNWAIFNPSYWEKVDQYNTLDTEKIAKADANGGISEYNNVYKPGTEGDFWSWSTLNNAVAMNKFAWSDLLVNWGLAKAVKYATLASGGVELAPGVMSTEASALSKVVNKAGSFGVLNSSSLGIDVAYGMQTYNDVLDKGNAQLDKVIQKDINNEIEKRLNTKEAQAEIQNYINEVNKQRQQRAGEKGNWIPISDEQAVKDYAQHLEHQIRAEQEELHKEDREEVRRRAADAFAVDATIEHLRMTGTAGMFKSYLFDKGTLNALRMNNPYVNTTFKNGAYALGKHATAKKVAQIFGQNVWGGFHSNYFDDITVGLAEGFGIQDYNNYLLSKYNPAAYGSVIDDYVNPWIAGMVGAKEASVQGRSFLDGAVGALGSVVTLTPNIGGIINHKQTMKQAKEQAEKDSKNGVKVSDRSGWETISDFATNPLIQAIADAKSATRMTEREINNVNKIIKDNAYALDNIVESANALNMKAITREGTSVMEAEDAKDREAFTLASQLLSLRNSGVVANAQAEPDKASWNKKKKAAHALTSAIDMMLGTDLFSTYSESPYTRAMQALQDASTINSYETEEEGNRKRELIDTFLGLDANKNAINGKTEEEKESFAIERLKKNANGLLGMIDSMKKINGKLDNSVDDRLSQGIKNQLMYQYVLDKRWKERLSEIEGRVTGEENTEKDIDSWYNEHVKAYNNENSTVAKYGTAEGYNRELEAQKKRASDAKDAYKKAKEELKKDADPNKSLMENSRINFLRRLKEMSAKKTLDREDAKLTAMEKEASTFITEKTDSEGNRIVENNTVPVIQAEDILKLSPNERLRMLDDFYRNDYTLEQQSEIDRAKNMLMKDGKTLNTVMEDLRDAAILSNRIADNMESAKEIMKRPAEAVMLQQSAIENRQSKVLDYFNDKIVLEAFQELMSDKNVDALNSADKVAEKLGHLSNAMLGGMQKMINKELKNEKSNYSNKTLDVISDGINKVIAERSKRTKDTVNLDSYLRKTSKVKHTEVVEETKEGKKMPQMVTSEYELTDNDRKLLDYALEYAVKNGIAVEGLAEAVTTEDFDKYVDERNHSYKGKTNPLSGQIAEVGVSTVENQANKVSPDYMKALVNDVVESYQKHKESVAETTKAKETTGASSVATASVEANSKEDNVVKHPEVTDAANPFGLNKDEKAEASAANAADTVANGETPSGGKSEAPQKVGEEKKAANTFNVGDELILTSYDADGNEVSEQSGSVKVIKIFDNGGIKVEALDGAAKEQQWEISPNKVKQFFGEVKPFTQGAHTDITYNDRLGDATPYKETPSEGNSEAQRGEETKKVADRNEEILEGALNNNEHLIKDIGTLLEEVDKMSMDDKVRDKLKDIIQALTDTTRFDNIRALQRKIVEESIGLQAVAPGISQKATALNRINIANANKQKAAKAAEKAPSIVPKPLPMTLSTMDLDFFIGNESFKPQWDYIENHGIVGFLQRLSDAWNKEWEKWNKTNEEGPIHQSQVVFLYDEALAAQIAESMKKSGMTYVADQHCPIIMAMEITDANKHLVEDVNQLITIYDVPGGGSRKKENLSYGHTKKSKNRMSNYYMPLGFMPANYNAEKENQPDVNTARRMSGIRDSIDFENPNNKKEPQIIKMRAAGQGGPIKTSLKGAGIETYTDPKNTPHSTEDTPITSVQQLMEENSQSATESFVTASEDMKKEYNEAVNSGDRAKVRGTSLYNKLREAFIKRLTKVKKEGETTADKDVSSLIFSLQKGSHSTYPKLVLIKAIGETIAKNTGKKIVDLLKEFDGNMKKAEKIINANSRFNRLFSKLKKIHIDGKALKTDAAGNVINEVEYKKALFEYGEAVKDAINNQLHVDDIGVEVTLSEDRNNINVTVYSGDKVAENALSTLTTSLGGNLSEAEFASFIKDLIIDSEGNTRKKEVKGKLYEKVKWQVNYNDVEKANAPATDAASRVDKKNAMDNLIDLYDDDIFEMQVTKLAYPARSVTVDINNHMQPLWAVPEVQAESPTGNHPTGQHVAQDGIVDGDTGALETPSRESIVKSIPANIMGAIQKIIEDSHNRKLTDDGKHYSIMGQLWSRVTSIKSALEGGFSRFNPKNGWGLPSTKIGNSLDEFGRDVFNEVFEGKSEEEMLSLFEDYDNSTAQNYRDVYQKLKEFEIGLRNKTVPQIIIGTLNRDTNEAGQITAKGMLNVKVKTDDGVVTKQVRVAGTLDVLAIDKNGNLHIYDFKTKHNGGLTKDVAVSKGYDRQLSMYAKFLEDELSPFGVKVESINIIPVDVNYPTPYGVDNDGKAISGAQKEFKEKESRAGSNQLLTKNIGADDMTAVPFRGANFQVREAFALTRLGDEALTASFEKMSAEEKAAIVEAINDQGEGGHGSDVKEGDVLEAKPEESQKKKKERAEVSDDNFDDLDAFFADDNSEDGTDTTAAGTVSAINPEEGLNKEKDDLKKRCNDE